MAELARIMGSLPTFAGIDQLDQQLAGLRPALRGMHDSLQHAQSPWPQADDSHTDAIRCSVVHSRQAATELVPTDMSAPAPGASCNNATSHSPRTVGKTRSTAGSCP